MSDEILQKTITTVKDFKNCIDKLDDALEDAGADASLRSHLIWSSGSSGRYGSTSRQSFSGRSVSQFTADAL